MIETLEQAKTHVNQGLSDGVVCPCCGQLAKLYRRKIYAAPARALISLYHKNIVSPDYYHITALDVDLGGSDFSKLKYWGLIEKAPNDDPEKHSSGLWMITPKGEGYVRDHISVPKYCYVFNNEAFGFSEEKQGIRDALGEKFDYNELMGFLI